MRILAQHRLTIAILLATPPIAISPALAYDQEVHYGLTYLIARKVGYTQFQARRIASADWSVDTNPDTEPLRLTAGITSLNKATPAQVTRARFHALPDTADELTYALTHGELRDAAHYRDSVNSRIGPLWQQALVTGNPGIYLHYLQDTFSHNGFTSLVGHTFNAPLTGDPTKTWKILWGGPQDFVANDLSKSYAMADATVQALANFMDQHGAQWRQHSCVPEGIQSTVTRLADANPLPRASIDLTVEPNWSLAKPVLEHDLGEPVPDFFQFTYDSEGTLVSPATQKPASVQERQTAYSLQEAAPAELANGKWWRGGTSNGVDRKITAQVFNQNQTAIDFHGGSEWDGGVFDDTKNEWTLSRSPSLQQIPEHVHAGGADVSIPKWAREQVQGKLQWHLTIAVDRCQLTANFYPGVIRWSEQTRQAWSPTERDNWGTPRTFTYKYDWAPSPHAGSGGVNPQ